MKNNTPTQYVQFDDNNYYQDNNDPKVTRKSYSCARSCAVGCLVLVVLVTVCGLLGYFLLLKGEPLIVATETTIITTPLKTDGKSVDFFQPIQKILEPQDKTKENGFKLVVAAYGKDFLLQHNPHINQDWIYDEICKQLELDPNQLPTHVYEAPKFEYREIDTKKLQAEIEKLKAEIENKKSENDYKEKKNEIERKQKALDEVVNSQYDLSKLEREPWSLQEYPKMQLWLDKVDDGLDIVQKAAMHDVFFVPMTRKSDQAITVTAINIPLIEQLQPLVRGLRTRGMLWIGEGDYQKAWNDILAAMRLERQLIHPQFSDDIPDETKQITINNIAKYSQNWSTELLNKAIADLDNLPEPKKRDELLTVVQFLTIDIFAEAHDASKLLEKLFAGNLDQAATQQMMQFGGIISIVGFNWNIVARKMNENIAAHKKTLDENNIDDLLNTTIVDLQKKLFAQISDGEQLVRKSGGNVLLVGGRSEVAGDFFGQLAVSAEIFLAKIQLDNITRSLLLKTAFALERHKKEHGNYPATLEELNLTPPTNHNIKVTYEQNDKGYKISIGTIYIEVKN